MLSHAKHHQAHKRHIADRMLIALLALPAATDIVIAIGGLLFAAYGYVLDLSKVESTIGLSIATGFACLAAFALVREMRFARRLEQHRQSDLQDLDRYDVMQLSIALFRLRGYQVSACQDPIERQAADLKIRRGKSSTLVRLRDWDDDRVGLGAVRALRAAVAETGAGAGTLLHRRAYAPDAWEFGLAKGLKLWLPNDLRALIHDTLGDPQPRPTRLDNATAAEGPRVSTPVADRQLLFLDLRLLDSAHSLAAWLLAHPRVELVATTERDDALTRIAAFDPRLSSRFVGTTPELPVGSSQRYFEIHAYLERHNLNVSGVRWLAIDSEAAAFPCAAPDLLIASAIDADVIDALSRTFRVTTSEH